MILRFRTESGSLYKLDKEKMTWERTYARKGSSGIIRNESGTLVRWPDIFEGQPAVMQDTNVREGANAHYVRTSYVVEISREG